MVVASLASTKERPQKIAARGTQFGISTAPHETSSQYGNDLVPLEGVPLVHPLIVVHFGRGRVHVIVTCLFVKMLAAE